MDSNFTYEVLVHREEGYIRVTAKGKMSLENLKQMYASVMLDPQYESGMSRLWDITQVDLSLLTTDQLYSFVEFMKNEGFGRDTAYVAILVTGDFEYGTCRMFHAIGHRILSPNIFVARNLNEALAWITKRSTGDVTRQWEIPENFSDQQSPSIPEEHI